MKRSMLEGSISKSIISFAIPMMVGNIFQQMYNAVDSIILGRFVGKEALAAVGVANPIMSITIFLIVGICLGASILMAQFYGAGEKERLKIEFSTTLITGAGFTVVMSVVCIFLAKPILVLTQTPEDILGPATQYLIIVFAGLIFTFFYNVYASALRAVGDSRTPLIFLIVGTVLNVVLDLLFVAVFQMNVLGAAIATVLAQGISALLCFIYTMKTNDNLTLSKDELKVDKGLLKTTISYSWVSAMQQTCLYVGKLLVQSAVNPLGTDVIAAFNTVTRVDAFATAPADSIAGAEMTFIAQNKGAGQAERTRKGFLCAVRISVCYGILISAVTFFFAQPIMACFVEPSETAIIEYGVQYLTLIACFYIIPGLCNVFQGYFRGVGVMKVTLIGTATQMAIRVILSYVLAPIMKNIYSVAIAIIVGWIYMVLYGVFEYYRYNRRQSTD